MRWRVARSIVMVATLSWGAAAHADDLPSGSSSGADDPDAIVTIGDAASSEPERLELPALEIRPNSASSAVDTAPPIAPIRVAASSSPPTTRTAAQPGDLVIDPATGLMIPRFDGAASSPRDGATSIRHRPAPTHRLRIDPSTGLMIPDFTAATLPTGERDPVPTRPSRPRSRQPTVSSDMQIDPATGLMIPRTMRVQPPF